MITYPSPFEGDTEIMPQAVPVAATAVTSANAHLKNLSVCNTTGSPVTFTLADQQGTPIYAFDAVSIPANATSIFQWLSGYFCPNGFTVLAGGAGLTFHAVWR